MEDTLTGEERASNYSVQAGYLKGAQEIGQDLVFDIQTGNSGESQQSETHFGLLAMNRMLCDTS